MKRPSNSSRAVNNQLANDYVAGLSVAGLKDLTNLLDRSTYLRDSGSNNCVAALRRAVRDANRASVNTDEVTERIRKAEEELAEAKRLLRESS